MLDKIRGVVLRERKSGESDKLLTVLTSSGKISMMAKGGRNLKNRNLSSASVFSYCDFVVYEKNGFCWLKETERIASFFNITENVDRLAFGQYFLELADILAVSDSDESRLLQLLLNALYALSTNYCSLWQIKAAFELRAAAVSGFEPDLNSCEICGKEETPLVFFPEDGVCRCRSCTDRLPPPEPGREVRSYPLSESVYRAMLYILSSDPKRVFSFKISESELFVLCEICEYFTVCRIEKRPFTLTFLHNMILDRK